jgi:hypothetical protein
VVNDLFNSVKTLFKSKGVLVVNGTKEVGGFLGGDQVGCTGKTDGERVELGPRGECRFFI